MFSWLKLGSWSLIYSFWKKPLSSSFYRTDRPGVLHFFGWRIFHRENCETKLPVLTFLKKSKKRRKVGAFLTPYMVQNIFGSYRLVITNLIWARRTSKIIHFLHFNTRTNLELLKKKWQCCYVYSVLELMAHMYNVHPNLLQLLAKPHLMINRALDPDTRVL